MTFWAFIVNCNLINNKNSTDTKLGTCIINPCNENQLDALFIHSLFCQSTPTCFGHICSPSSDNQLISTTRTNCCIHTVYLLMMGYKYARNM